MTHFLASLYYAVSSVFILRQVTFSQTRRYFTLIKHHTGVHLDFSEIERETLESIFSLAQSETV